MIEQRHSRLGALLSKLHLEVDEEVYPALLWFLDELLRWNRKVNLTAITDPEEALEKHLVDSLTLLPLLGGGERMLDLGSGGGFPGLPLKIARPNLQVVSVDAVGKKIAFQRHAARQLHLKGFDALQERAGNIPQRPGMEKGFDLVVSRAFTSLDQFAALALPCLLPGGLLVAMKGAEGERELATTMLKLQKSGFTDASCRCFHLPESGAERTLILMRTKPAINTCN